MLLSYTRQVTWVEYLSDEQKRARWLVTNQEDEGTVHAVRKRLAVASRGGAGILATFRRRLHDNLVTDRGQLHWLRCDFVKLWGAQPIG